MIHYSVEQNPAGNHWGVSWTGPADSGNKASRVLAQLQEDGNQARIALTPDEAEDMAAALMRYATRVRESEKACNNLNAAAHDQADPA